MQVLKSLHKIEGKVMKKIFRKASILLQNRHEIATNTVLQDQPQVSRCFIPSIKLQHIRVIKRVNDLDFLKELGPLGLVDALDGVVLDCLLLPPFVDGLRREKRDRWGAPIELKLVRSRRNTREFEGEGVLLWTKSSNPFDC